MQGFAQMNHRSRRSTELREIAGIRLVSIPQKGVFQFKTFLLLDTLKGFVNQRHSAVYIERGCGFKKPPTPCIDPRIGIIVFVQQIV